jgi:hypothetical protein
VDRGEDWAEELWGVEEEGRYWVEGWRMEDGGERGGEGKEQ